jgi:flagellar motor protein MotB
MKFYIPILLFLISCSSTKEGFFFQKQNTDIEKTFEKDDKSLEKFSVQEVYDPALEQKAKEAATAVKAAATEVKTANPEKLEKPKQGKKTAVIKKADTKKQPKKIQKKPQANLPKVSEKVEKKKSDLLNKVKSQVALDIATEKKEERPLPKDYPKEFLEYDKKAEGVWDIFKPKVFLDEAHVFEVSYLGITAGTIRIETKKPVRLANEPAFHFKVLLKSSDYYKYIYELNDTLESFVRMRDFMPLKYKLVQRESGQEVDDLQVFDYDTQKTTFWYRKLKKGKEKKDKKEKYIPHYFQDSFSGLQFVRGLPLKLGEKYQFPIVTRTKVWIMTLEIVNTLDKIEVADQTFDAIKIKAETRFPGVLKKRGDIIFWFSNDKYRRLLKFEAKIKIGSVKGHLVKYEEGKGLQ